MAPRILPAVGTLLVAPAVIVSALISIVGPAEAQRVVSPYGDAVVIAGDNRLRATNPPTRRRMNPAPGAIQPSYKPTSAEVPAKASVRPAAKAPPKASAAKNPATPARPTAPKPPPIVADAVPPAPTRKAKAEMSAKPAAVIAPGEAEAVGLSSQRLARIGEVLQHEVASGRLPGAVLHVARRGRVVYQQAWGHLDPSAKSPMPANALFRVYGLGQPIVTVAALMLVEDGIVQLTDPVSRYLPMFKDLKVATERGSTDANRPVTVHDLLRFTAGLAYGDGQTVPRLKAKLVEAGLSDPLKAALKTRPLSANEQVQLHASLPLAAQPGTSWQIGRETDLLGRVVEAAAGKPLGVFLQERLLMPLDMRHTHFVIPAAESSRIAQPASVDRLIDHGVPPGNQSAGSGLIMGTADVLRFGQMLLNGGVLDGKRVLSPSTVRLMTADHLGAGIQPAGKSPGQILMGTGGYGFGLGVAVRKADGVAGVPGSAGEYGWGSHAGSLFWVDPKEQLVAVFQSQSPGSDRERHRRLVKQLVYQAIIE